MSESWLEPLLDPSGLLDKARGRQPDLRMGAAMLLDGRTLEYLRAQDESDLPQFGRPGPSDAPPDRALVAGISAHLSGEPSAGSLYRRIVEGASDADLRITAGVLAAIALDDQGDVLGALSVLDGLSRNLLATVGDLLLLVQRSVRLAEAGSWSEARDAAEAARSARTVKGPLAWVDALRRVSAYNQLSFGFHLNLAPRTFNLPSRARSRLLSHVDDMISEGLASYFSEGFDSSFVHPYEQSVKWSAQDAVATPLFGALLRAECLGDWMGLERVRKLTGRYVLVSSLGRPERQPTSGFHLLRRAGDTKAIERAVEAYRRFGPLLPLRTIGEQLVQSQWLRRETAANLVLLASVADVLSEGTASQALARALSRDVLDAIPTWDVLRALPALLESSDTSSQTQTAQTVLDLLTPQQYPLTIQAVNMVVGALRWDEVPSALTHSWLGFAAAQIQAGPYDVLAASILRALRDLFPDDTRRVALEAFQEKPSVFLASVCAEVAARPPSALTPVFSRVLRDDLLRIRADASKGSFSMSVANSAGAATWFLLASPGDEDLWQDVLDFLGDPHVAASEKIGAIDALTGRAEEIPARVAVALSESLHSIAAATPPLFGLREEFEGAILRLGSRLGSFSPDDATGRLLGLGAGTPAARMEAARSVPAAAPQVPIDALASLVLSLTQDSNLDVRFAGATVLPGVEAKTDGPLAGVLRSREFDLLNDPGALVPLGVCWGVRDARKTQFHSTEQLQQALGVVMRTHLSNAVRRAAREALS
jgi:hypothetical protein